MEAGVGVALWGSRWLFFFFWLAVVVAFVVDVPARMCVSTYVCIGTKDRY